MEVVLLSVREPQIFKFAARSGDVKNLVSYFIRSI